MDYILLPSLKEAAAVRIASFLYNESEIETMVGKDIDQTPCQLNEKWEVKEMEIAERLSSLLPRLLQKAVAKIIRPMHKEVKNWKADHEFLLKHLGASWSCTWLSWKTVGTINRIQTAKKIIMNDDIDPKIRFVISCTYFLEKEVLSLWERNKEIFQTKSSFMETNLVVRFWLKWLTEKDVKHWSEMVGEYFTAPCFKKVHFPLRVSCFYRFLSRENKKKCIKLCEEGFAHSDDFQTCVNNMDENERIEIHKSNRYRALELCLNWPYRSLFIKKAKTVINNLSYFDFVFMLIQLLFKYKLEGYEDFHIFYEFWQMSPPNFKDEVKEGGRFFKNISYSLEGKNMEALKEIVTKCFE